jgi:Domain of unknown function (DUF3850)
MEMKTLTTGWDHMTTHKLKIWPRSFAALSNRTKTYEVRKNDRDFQIGDTLLLEEYNIGIGTYTGRAIERRVFYVTGPRDPEAQGLKEGYVVLRIE